MKLLDRIGGWLGFSRYYAPSDPTWALTRLVDDKDRLVDPYLQHVWVYSCIKAIATNIAAVPWQLYSGAADSARLIQDGVLYERFNRPNALWTRYHLWEATVSHLKSSGNSIWVLKRDTPKQPPAEILVFGSEGWSCELDAENKITTYIYDTHDARGKMRLPPEQVVHFRTWNPKSDIWGLGEIEAARMSADQDYMASLYNRSFFVNSAMPGGIIKLPAGQSLTDAQWNSLKARWNDIHQGARKGFKLAALEGGAEFETISLSHRDMMFLEQRKWNRGEILACFKVPPSELGIFDDVQKAVQESVERGFWNKTLLPTMRLIEDTLRAQFFLPLDNERTWGKFDLSAVAALQKNTGELITQAQQLFGMGMPMSLINEYLGMDIPEYDGWDSGYLPMSVIPSDMAGMANELPEESMPAEEEPTAEKAAAEAMAKQAQAASVLVTRDALPHTPEQVAEWEAFVRAITPSERGMQESVRVYLNRVKKWLAEKLANRDNVDDIPADALELAASWDKELRDLAAEHYRRIAIVQKPRVEARLKKVGIDFDLNLKDKRLVEYLRGKEIKVVDINDRIRAGVREALAEAQEEKLTVNELQESIFSVMQDSRARALRIARTETTSAANGVEYVSHAIAGVKTHMWLAALDENTRESHLACMRQGEVEVGKKFVNGLRFPGDPAGEVGEVVNCYLPGTVVSGAFIGGSKAFYSGEAIEVITRGGIRIAVTANHPVFANGRWMCANELREGDRLFCHDGNFDRQSAINWSVYNQETPASIENIFDAFACKQSALVRAGDFYGDGVSCKGQVDIVTSAHGKLSDNSDTTLTDGISDCRLPSSDVTVASVGTVALPRSRIVRASARTPRGGALLLDQGTVATIGTPLETLRAGPAADLNAQADETAKENRTADPRLERQLFEACASEVFLDQVIKVRDFSYSGHVFDLQSTTGLIIAQGIVCSNCRCSLIPVE